jgi:hypothetical protein
VATARRSAKPVNVANKPTSPIAGSGLAVAGKTGLAVSVAAGTVAGGGSGAAAASKVGGVYNLASNGFSAPDLSTRFTAALGKSTSVVAAVEGTLTSVYSAIFAEKPFG